MSRPCIRLRILTACLALLVSGGGCRQQGASESRQPAAPSAATVEQVCRITAEFLDVPADQVKPTTTFGELDADALDAIEIVMALEEHFKIRIPDEAVYLDAEGDSPDMKNLTMTQLGRIVEEQKLDAK